MYAQCKKYIYANNIKLVIKFYLWSVDSLLENLRAGPALRMVTDFGLRPALRRRGAGGTLSVKSLEERFEATEVP